ncbi:hypothetical protein PR001_g1815 [Phytophthora rubi]|uniref:Uncharacterized protein n=1 Tax=Phytophthora rubi TaxID=129364 RepID=A0A6A3NL37_9STRA|nr:hypothetical protein PR002_g1879 [Phytophthora rubi]KAE9051053.1 hypothetical protein PR001_g1815 [Phytophthora rubi]
MMEPNLLLQTARVATRYCLPNGHGELPHVMQLLDAYLDSFSASWTIVTAYERTKSLRCVQFVAARELAEVQDPFYKRWLLNRTAEDAARGGDLPAVRWIMESYLPVETVDNVTDVAAANGHLQILQWLYDHHRQRVRFGGVEMCGALEYKNERVVRWLRCHAVPRVECRNDVLRSAAKAGNLDVVQWMCEEFGLDGAAVLKVAVRCCQWETARWIIERFSSTGPLLDMYFAAHHGVLSFMKYMAARELGGFYTGTLVVAAAYGHLDVVKWLHQDRGLMLTVDVMKEAAQDGHLNVVKWLFETSSDLCDSSVLVSAAEFGRLAVLQWLQPRWSGTLGTVAMDWAARNGHLEVVKWLHTNGTDGCSAKAMDEAAVNGHLDVVQWLHEQRREGCTKRAMDGAAGAGYLEVVQWLHEHRTEGCSTIAMNQAACNGHLNIVKWLHHNRKEGCTTLAMDEAAKNGHLKIVKWLHGHRGLVCSTHAMYKAASYGHLDVLKWMAGRCSDGCSSVAMTHAVMCRHFDVVLFLHLHGKRFIIPLNTTLHLPPEMQQWVLANYADELQDCQFEVPKVPWRLPVSHRGFRRVEQPPVDINYNFTW